MTIDSPRLTRGTGALTREAMNRVMEASDVLEEQVAQIPGAIQAPQQWLFTYLGRVTGRMTLTANRFQYTVEPVVLTSAGLVSGVALYGFATATAYNVLEISNTATTIRNPPMNLDNLPDGFTLTYPDSGDVFEITVRRDSAGNPSHQFSAYFGVDGECEEPPA